MEHQIIKEYQYLTLEVREKAKYSYAKNLMLTINRGNEKVLEKRKIAEMLCQITSGVLGEDRKLYFFHFEKLKALKGILNKRCRSVVIVYSSMYEKEAIMQMIPHAQCLESNEDIDAWNDKKCEIGLLSFHMEGKKKVFGDCVVIYSLPFSAMEYGNTMHRFGGIYSG